MSNDLLNQIFEACRINNIKAGCYTYRVLLTELKIGDQIQTKIDNVFHEPRWNDTSRGEFKLFNGFHSAYDLKEKSFMSKLRTTVPCSVLLREASERCANAFTILFISILSVSRDTSPGILFKIFTDSE